LKRKKQKGKMEDQFSERGKEEERREKENKKFNI